MGQTEKESLSSNRNPYGFLKAYQALPEVLSDRQLAQLGDAYVNFAFSLALSERKKRPEGKKVRGSMLAEALRKSGLRESLPSRLDRHTLSDAGEAIVVYAWLHGLLTLDESVQILIDSDDWQNGFEELLRKAKDRVMRSGLFEKPH
jgi:hypothetical protein